MSDTAEEGVVNTGWREVCGDAWGRDTSEEGGRVCWEEHAELASRSFNTEEIFTSSELGSDASEGCVGVVDTGLKVCASTLRIKGASGIEGVANEGVFDGMKDVG